jgi:hypothetical protein
MVSSRVDGAAGDGAAGDGAAGDGAAGDGANGNLDTSTSGNGNRSTGRGGPEKGDAETVAAGGGAAERIDTELMRLAAILLVRAIAALLDTTIVNVALRTIGQDLHAPLGVVQW